MKRKGEIVLITGGSGFLGQHIVKLLQERDPSVDEIRVVDLVKYENRLGHMENKKFKSYIGSICEPEEINEAFVDVDCVFHCAAYINFEFPAHEDKLNEVNVNGTKKIIDLCIKHNIPRLVYTSSTAVTFTPYMGRGTFCLIINQTENKAKPPTIDSGFLMGSFAASKYRAEKLVLSSTGRLLANDNDYLKTVALRPTILYGEQDQRFFPNLLRVGEKMNGQIPRLSGAGGKQQISYAGNVAWAHIRAKDTLDVPDNKIIGLPIFITDDTPIEDTFRFCQRISRATNKFKLRPSWWSLPTFLTYFLAFLLEFFVKHLNPIFNNIKLKFTPTAIASYTSSIFMYSRLRASIHLDYEPIFSEEKSILYSVKWYEKWYEENILCEKLRKLKGN